MKCFFENCSDAVSFAAETESFGVFYSDKKNQNRRVHIHECCELFLCVKGGSSFLIDDKVYGIADGDLFLINQFEAHKVVPDKDADFERYILHVHPAFIHSCSSEDVNLADLFYADGKVAKISLSKTDSARLIELFEALRREYPYADAMYKKLRATEILLEASKLLSVPHSSLSGEFGHKTVQLAIDYINENYGQPIFTEDVARNVFSSPSQLSRLFVRCCGISISKYILSKRITEAKKMLADGSSVTAAAFSCGFNDYASFIRAFKKAVGVPPGKYKTGFHT